MKRTFFNKTRTISSLVVLLMSLPVWGKDGDTFTEKTVEGVMLTYTIISELEKTCMVGEEYLWPTPTSRTDRVRKASESQPSGDITIPEVANGYAVIRIEAYAFENAAITSVVIPNSVKAIEPYAFWGCINLKSVKLSNQLTAIKEFTFAGCENLTSIDIPEGVTTIGESAFWGCSQLKEATIPSSVVHFGDCVFCSAGFTSMPKLPEGLTTIPYGIFQSCPLTSVEIPTNITSIDGCAFNNCLFTEIEIPASVTHIGVAAFARCKNLSSIVIPNNVKTIEFNAFYNCSNLKSVTLSNNLSSLSEGVFSNCSSLDSIVIPNGVKAIGRWAFSGCSALRSISIPETVEEIDDRVFSNCTSLTKLFIPKGVVRINTEGYPLLAACNSLNSIIVDEDNPIYDSRHNSNAIIETASNKIIAGCPATKIPEGITAIGSYAFCGHENLTSITLPQSLKQIEGGAFNNLGLKEINIPGNVTSIAPYAFSICKQLEKVKTYIKDPFEIPDNAFYSSTTAATLYVPKGTVDKYKSTKGWNVFSTITENTEPEIDIAYRPFIEEDKVWKVGYGNRNPIQFVEYYYFDGDTIIDGRTCKQMMCQRYVTPDYSDYEVIMRYPLLRRSGVWYEEDKKVYEYNTTDKQFKLMYDFSVDDNATLQIHGQSYVVGPKLTEGLKGFKGVYRNVMWPSWDGEQIYDEGHHNTTWLEGVGSIEGPGYNVYLGKEYHGGAFLMACYAGDEVIYFNDEYEDGATPEVTGSRKNRFDFSHTVKTKPKSRTTRGAEPSLYGEYNDQQLGINLNPLYDTYLVSITDETGKTVYEKNINAGAIVGLNIDISAYPEGRYTVTVENNNESFTGQFDAQTVGLSDAVRLNNNGEMINDNIFDLQGRQLQGKPQRGLYIQNGKKVMVK